MQEPTFSLRKRKDFFKNMVTELENLIQSREDYLLEACRGNDETSSIKGLFIDKRSLRAIGLKIKMLLTLLQKAYAIWRENPELRRLLRLPDAIEGLIEKNPWKAETSMIIRIEMVPFIAGEYIQPSIKFLEVECDGIESSFAQHRSLAGRFMQLLTDFDFQGSTFSYPDSFSFFRQSVVEACGERASAVGIVIGRSKEGQKNLEIYRGIAQFLNGGGIRTEVLDPDKTGESFDLLINTVRLESLVKVLSNSGLDWFMNYWEKGKVINPGAHPAFTPGIFEILTDMKYQNALGSPPIDTIKRMIPWTRVIRDTGTTTTAGEVVRLPDYIMLAQDYLIMKPNYAAGNNRLLRGESSSKEQWETALQEALISTYPYVVQENLELPSVRFPFRENQDLIWKDPEISFDLTVNERGDIGSMGTKLHFGGNTGLQKEKRATGYAPVIIADID